MVVINHFSSSQIESHDVHRQITPKQITVLRSSPHGGVYLFRGVSPLACMRTIQRNGIPQKHNGA